MNTKTKKWNGSQPTSATSYNGFYFRNNLAGNSEIPSNGPYNLCPDIIQSDMMIDDPTQILGSSQSWANTYNAEPGGGSNYYYLRGTNPNNAPVDANLNLYFCPAQLILLPETWQNNKLSTSTGLSTVTVHAGAGQTAVATEPLLWPDAPAPTSSDFYSLIAQASDSDNPDPVPTVTSWIDMSDLLNNNLGYGFRNTCYVPSDMATWARNFQLTIPADITNPGTLQIMLTATGFTGNSLALASDSSDINIDKLQVPRDGFSVSTQFNPTAGSSISLSLNYWSEATSFPASGATITVSALYLVEQNDVHEAGTRGTVKHAVSKLASEAVGMPVKTWILLGCATFVVE
jgi:hypothetical protein